MARRAFLLGRNTGQLRHCAAYDEQGALVHSDLRLMQECLHALGFEQVTVAACAWNYQDILDQLAAVTRACVPEDTFVFYFAGHSFGQNGLQLVIANDIRERRNWIPASQIVGFVRDCPALCKLIVLDSCESGQAADGMLPDPGCNIRVLTATDGTYLAQERKSLEAGVFTYHLWKALTEETLRHSGRDGVLDEDGNLCLERVHRWLRREVPRYAKDGEPKIPEPQLYGGAGKEIYFATGIAPYRPLQLVPSPLSVGYPAELLNALTVALQSLGVGSDSAGSAYAQCRSWADSDILPWLAPGEGLAQVLAILTDPGRYYFAGNRLKLPLLSFVAHLSEALDHPQKLKDWLAAARTWLIETGGIARARVEEAARPQERPTPAEPQPYLMVQVMPALAAEPGSYSVAWDYIDEYGTPAKRGDPGPACATQDQVIGEIVAAARALPGRAPCKPQIEVLLSFALLADDAFADALERALFRPGDRPPLPRLALGDLAAEFPLVLRSWERWFEPLLVNNRGGTDAREFWHDKADCLAKPVGPPCLDWLRPASGQSIQAAAICRLRHQEPGRRPLALGCSASLQRGDLAGLLDAGIPVLLWPRHRVPTPAVLRSLKVRLASPPPRWTLSALPRALHEHRCRQAAEPPATPCDFSLLWEDPDRPIFDQPDYDTSYMG